MSDNDTDIYVPGIHEKYAAPNHYIKFHWQNVLPTTLTNRTVQGIQPWKKMKLIHSVNVDTLSLWSTCEGQYQ
jgi:hypothetical protein